MWCSSFSSQAQQQPATCNLPNPCLHHAATAAAATAAATYAAHLPFSHHNLTPTLKRGKGEAPMPFTPLHIPQGDSAEDVEARPSFTMAHKAPLATFDFPSGAC